MKPGGHREAIETDSRITCKENTVGNCGMFRASYSMLRFLLWAGTWLRPVKCSYSRDCMAQPIRTC